MAVVVLYEVSATGLLKAMMHLQDHKKRLQDYYKKGVLLMAGPMGTPPMDAMAIFTDKESANEFVEGDPFVLHNVVAKYRILDWNNVLEKKADQADRD